MNPITGDELIDTELVKLRQIHSGEIGCRVGRLIELLESIKTLRNAIRKHRDQKGDDRCWLDDLELYKALPEGVADADLRLPSPEKMLENCKRFIQCRHTGTDYVSEQREIETLTARTATLESYLEKTADGKLVCETETFFCPHCTGIVRKEYDLAYCDNCDNKDSSPAQPPLPMFYSACYADRSNIPAFKK